MKRLFILLFPALMMSQTTPARTYVVSPGGNDNHAGTIKAPFATLARAQQLVTAGDTVLFRGGTYKVKESQIMRQRAIWAYVFTLSKSGTEGQPICYRAYPGERPVFDLSQVKPAGKRIFVFYVTGSYLHLEGLEVTGTQVTITTHTQSECFHNEGSHNVYDRLSMHDGMAIGFYLTHGHDNLIIHCDAYRNYDSVSEQGRGGNTDGFGCHPYSPADSANVFVGCRAWLNSDDGFDLINAQAPVTFAGCWAMANGLRPDGRTPAADGNGFKAGGYGMGYISRVPAVVPRHVIQGCVAFGNRANGFYANHHLGGSDWTNNLAYANGINYNMVNRRSAAEAVDVPGYGHRLTGNRSYCPRGRNGDLKNVNQQSCLLRDNQFPSTEALTLTLDSLTQPRLSDGSLPLSLTEMR